MTLCNNKQKAIVHIIKNKYGITDEEYRGLLIDNFDGIDTTVCLSEGECEKFIHILNYKYNQDYKNGYDRGVKQCMVNMNLEEKFRFVTKSKYNRDITELELRMFNSMYDTDKENVIESLM